MPIWLSKVVPDTRARAAKRVTEGNRAAVKIDLLVDLLHQAKI